jgi:hypothetical protein
MSITGIKERGQVLRMLHYRGSRVAIAAQHAQHQRIAGDLGRDTIPTRERLALTLLLRATSYAQQRQQSSLLTLTYEA